MKTKLIAISLLSLSLSGCIQFFPQPAEAPGVFRLNFDTEIVPTLPDAKSVAVSYPRVPRAISGTAIALSPDGERLLFADRARWQEPVPRLLQASFLDAFGNEANLIGVRPGTGAQATYAVDIDIRKFEAVFDNGREDAPLATYQAVMTITHLRTRELIGSREFRATHRSQSARIGDIVRAMDNVSSDLSRQAVNWIDDETTAYEAR